MHGVSERDAWSEEGGGRKIVREIGREGMCVRNRGREGGREGKKDRGRKGGREGGREKDVKVCMREREREEGTVRNGM